MTSVSYQKGGWNRVVAAIWLLAGAAWVVCMTGCQSDMRRPGSTLDGRAPIRAIWVTRWDYKTPADISKIMDNCLQAGFNTVLFQVRGNGTALYRSKLEPWAEEFEGRDPGFDPLAVACREAHRRGLSLQAWANVMPGWFGKKPPNDPRQLYHAHADWFWRDARGRRQPLGWYASLNPCYPEVRRYIVAVMHEIVSKYPVDGLHLDYIRFPNDWHKSYSALGKVPDYPRDPRTLAMFRRATGQTPESAPGRWNSWRTENVTQLLRQIRAMTRSVAPRITLSAAVGASPNEAKRTHYQDSLRWLSEGLLDAVFPMNYSSDMLTFNRRIAAWSNLRLRIPVIHGVMSDRREASGVIRQIDHTVNSCGHFAVFAYNSMFERRDKSGRPQFDSNSGQRTALRRRMIPYLRRIATLGWTPNGAQAARLASDKAHLR